MKGDSKSVANMHYRTGQPNVAFIADFAEELFLEEKTSPLREKLGIAVRDELTPRQLEITLLYYGEGLTLQRIGQRLGLHKSTVSRTLHRAEKRLERCLKYGAANLLHPKED